MRASLLNEAVLLITRRERESCSRILVGERGGTAVAKKKDDDGFIASVPEMIEEVRKLKEATMNNEKIPFPWPGYVPTPAVLDQAIEYLQKVYDEIGDDKIRTGGELGRARKSVKTRFSQLVRYAALTLEGVSCVANWPGFDLGRNPGEVRKLRSRRCKKMYGN
jgi:hypothetical protein